MALDIKTTDLLHRLHKRLGIRNGQLSADLLKTQLPKRWDIAESDTADVVRAKVIYRLEDVFDGLAPRDSKVWPVIYNKIRDISLHNLELHERVAGLPARFPELSVSKRTVDRVGQGLRDRLQHHVTHTGYVPFDQVRLGEIIRDEREFARQVQDGSEFDQRVRETFDSKLQSVQVAFLKQRTAVSLSATGQLVVARTRLGNWVCAFASTAALQAYRDAVRWPEHTNVGTLSGAELVRQVLKYRSIGIVYNPIPDRSAAVQSTLALTPAELAGLADRL